MNFKILNNLHFTSIILFFLALALFFSEPNVYRHIFLQLSFYLTLYSLLYYLIKIFKLANQNKQSFFFTGQLIFYLFLLFVVDHYNEQYTSKIFIIFSFIMFLFLLVFGLLFIIYYRLTNNLIKQ